MKLIDLSKELDNNLDTIYKCILITGKWGIGKTYYIDNYVNNNDNVYKVSLFGIKDIDDFKFSLSYVINSRESVLQKTVTENDRIELNLGLFTIPIPKLRKNYEEIIESNLNECNKNILIIDDLERIGPNINMEDILGIIEELNKIEYLNIVVIANEEEIKDNNKDIYNRFKEKVIERVYYIDEYDEKAVDNICSNIKDKNVKKILKHLYINSNNKNLRTLIKTVKYLNQIFKNIKIKELTENNIIRLVKCILYLMIGINENKLLDNKIGSSLIKEYWDKEVDKNELGVLSELLYNYYLSNDVAYCKLVEASFKANKIIEPEKDLFYCSKEELISRANIFRDKVINKYNNNYDIINFENELSKLDYYLSKAGLNNYYNDNEIESAINLYINNIDINKKKVYDYIKIMPDRFDSDLYNKYHNIINTKIVNKYIDEYIKVLVEETNNKIYKDSSIEDLYQILRHFELHKYYGEDVVNRLKEYNFFLPDLNNDLSEDSWGFAHSICKSFNMTDSNYLIKIEFIKYLDNLLESGTELGKYRIRSLKDQYGL